MVSKEEVNSSMKEYVKWLIIIFILVGIIFLRVVPKKFFASKKVFLNKDISSIEIGSENKIITIKKIGKEWLVNNKYPGDSDKINSVINDIKSIEIVGIVSRTYESLSDFGLEEQNLVKLKVIYDKNKEKVLLLGKTGGFSFNETFAIIEPKKEVLLIKGINRYTIKQPFYNFCEKTIINSDIEKIVAVSIKEKNKEVKLKKELTQETTQWININKTKTVEKEKIDSLLNNFKNFSGDIIIETTDLKEEDLKLSLSYINGSEIKLVFYSKVNLQNEPEVIPVKIFAENIHPPEVNKHGDSNIIYGIYNWRYESFKQTIKSCE